MKLFIKIAFIASTAVLFSSCVMSPSSNNTLIQSGGGGGGRGSAHTEKVRIRRSADSVFGNQGAPDMSRVRNATWGQTSNSRYYWNDLQNGEAERQPVSPDEPVLVDENGKTWRPRCRNRIIAAPEPVTTYETAQSGGGGYAYQDNRSYTDFKVEFNMPITIVGGGQLGGGYGCQQYGPQRGYRQPQRPIYRPQQHMRQPQYCLVRNNCGQVVGRRMIGYR